MMISPHIIGDFSKRGPEIEKRPASNDETQWPHYGVRSAMPGAAILYWPTGTLLNQPDRSFAVLEVADQTGHAETASLPS